MLALHNLIRFKSGVMRGGKQGMDRANQMTADGAAHVAAMLTKTIVETRLPFIDPNKIKPYVMETFREVLDELIESDDDLVATMQTEYSGE